MASSDPSSAGTSDIFFECRGETNEKEEEEEEDEDEEDPDDDAEQDDEDEEEEEEEDEDEEDPDDDEEQDDEDEEQDDDEEQENGEPELPTSADGVLPMANAPRGFKLSILVGRGVSRDRSNEEHFRQIAVRAGKPVLFLLETLGKIPRDSPPVVVAAPCGTLLDIVLEHVETGNYSSSASLLERDQLPCFCPRGFVVPTQDSEVDKTDEEILEIRAKKLKASSKLLKNLQRGGKNTRAARKSLSYLVNEVGFTIKDEDILEAMSGQIPRRCGHPGFSHDALVMRALSTKAEDRRKMDATRARLRETLAKRVEEKQSELPRARAPVEDKAQTQQRASEEKAIQDLIQKENDELAKERKNTRPQTRPGAAAAPPRSLTVEEEKSKTKRQRKRINRKKSRAEVRLHMERMREQEPLVEGCGAPSRIEEEVAWVDMTTVDGEEVLVRKEEATPEPVAKTKAAENKFGIPTDDHVNAAMMQLNLWCGKLKKWNW
jgi:hypothetical protein